VASAITYAIPVPALLLLCAAFPAWRRVLGALAVAIAVFAAVAIGADRALRRPESAIVPNNVIAIAFMTFALAVLLRPATMPSPDRRLLRIGLASLFVTAVADNLRGMHVVAWRGPDAEPLGSTVLIACLGTIAVRRVFADAQRLLALDRELHLARGIQASILPRAMPNVAGLSVAARYEPMTAVAGDFYEFLDLGRSRLGVLVADVSGHGVPAALIASMVKVAIAGQRARAESPSSVLTGMNETLSGQLGGQYVTAAYLFLDREAGVMRYAAAGHPPLLVFPREAAAREVEENGLPLGILDGSEYGQVEAPLRAGDRFLLYTDGLVDATNPAGEFFTLERVKQAVADAAGLSTSDGADLLLARARAWAQAAAADDLPVVLLDCV